MKHTKSKHTSKTNKKRVRTVVSFMLSFLIAMDLLIMFSAVGLYLGLFSTNALFGALDKSGYYDKVYDTFMDKSNEILKTSSLPEDIIANIVTEQQMSMDTKKSIEKEFKGSIYELDTTQMEQSIKDNINRYIEQTQIQGVTEEGMKALTTSIVTQYKQLVSFPFTSYYLKYQAIYHKLFYFVFGFTLFAAIVMTAILVAIQRWKHRGLRYAVHGIMGAAIMITVLPAALLISNVFSKLQISPVYFKDFIISFLQWNLSIFLYMGLALVILYAIMLFVIQGMRSKLVSTTVRKR